MQKFVAGRQTDGTKTGFLCRSTGLRLFCAVGICVALVGLDVARRAAVPPLAHAVWPTNGTRAASGSVALVARGQIPKPANTPTAHSSSLLALPPGQPSALLAFWFAGSGEGSPDVQIAASRFDRATQRWSATRWVVNRQFLAEQLGFGVRRLGNPVAWLDRSGKVHLFVVTTGLGGWAASRIVHLRQSDEGRSFEELSFQALRVLPLSWLWNTSFLVRTAPLPLKDGGMVLPVYFELGIKYPVALRFDASGEFKGMVRISSRLHVLQPTLVTVSESHWLALLRDQRLVGKVAVSETMDAGQSWSDLPDLALDNPNSSVAALALAPGRMFLAHNSSPHSRTALDLSASADGRSWALAQALAHGVGSDEYSYPAMAWADDSLWLSYTDQRRSIAWQRFSFLPPAR
jgi:predicted neuraminidase